MPPLEAAAGDAAIAAPSGPAAASVAPGEGRPGHLSDNQDVTDDTATSRRRNPFVVVGIAVVGVLLVVAVGLLARGGTIDVATDPGGDDPTESAYLRAIQAVQSQRGEVLADLRVALNGTYSNRATALAAFAAAAREIDAGGMAAEARAIEPPPGYKAGHVSWVESLDETEALRLAVIRAAERDDLSGLSRAVAELEVLDLRTASTAPPSLCRVLLGGAATRGPAVAEGAQLCADPAELPGGAHGVAMWRAAMEVRVEVFPRIAAFFPTMTDAERLATLAVIQGDVESVFARVRDELAQRTAPLSLQADHEAFLAYLDGMAEIAGRITQAARAGDADALPELFAESAQPPRDLERSVSDTGRVLLQVLFVE